MPEVIPTKIGLIWRFPDMVTEYAPELTALSTLTTEMQGKFLMLFKHSLTNLELTAKAAAPDQLIVAMAYTKFLRTFYAEVLEEPDVLVVAKLEPIPDDGVNLKENSSQVRLSLHVRASDTLANRSYNNEKNWMSRQRTGTILELVGPRTIIEPVLMGVWSWHRRMGVKLPNGIQLWNPHPVY